MVCISFWLYVWILLFDSLSRYDIGIYWVSCDISLSLYALMSISMEFIQFYSHNWKKDKIKIIVMIIVIIINREENISKSMETASECVVEWNGRGKWMG